jgi:uncharacterized RDD family membrane protein YckC
MHNPYKPPAAELDTVEPVLPMSHEVLQYAGFWRRFGAYWIDVMVLLPLAGIAYVLGQQSRMLYFGWMVGGVFIGLWFHVYLVARYGGTPGKLLLRMRIAMLSGATVTPRAAALRYTVLFVLTTLSSIALAIALSRMSDQEYFSLRYGQRSLRLIALAPAWYGVLAIVIQIWIWGEFIVMMCNRKRRAVDDFIGGTVVLVKNAES